LACLRCLLSVPLLLKSAGGPWAVLQLTRWKVERGVYWAVDNACLEAGIRVAERDRGTYNIAAALRMCISDGIAMK
jgi:hypothetical protein